MITTVVLEYIPNNISLFSNRGEAMGNIIPNGRGAAYRCHRGKNKNKIIVLYKNNMRTIVIRGCIFKVSNDQYDELMKMEKELIRKDWSKNRL
jgi:hypothetical protein